MKDLKKSFVSLSVDPIYATEHSDATRVSLIGRIKNLEDNSSWTDFFNTYWKLIYSTAIKAGLNPDEAQDVVQETILSVSKSMPGFEYKPEVGSFKSWLLRLTYWRITDQFRKRLPKSVTTFDTEDEKAFMDNKPDPSEQFESIWNQEWEQNLMGAAIQRVKEKIDPKQYQIFDLVVLRGWPLKKVQEHLKASAAKLYLTKHRVSKRVKEELKNLQGKYNAKPI